MRHLLVTVVAGGILATIGVVHAQTPQSDTLPRINSVSTASPQSAAPSYPLETVSLQQGNSTPAALTASSLEAQVKAQKKDIDTLIKTVELLTTQLQLASHATIAREAGGTSAPLGLDATSAQTLPRKVPDELLKTQEMLVALNNERGAMQQAPADEQLKKEVELQRKQIDLLNRMVRLYAAELEKQGPAVSKMQTQVATLEARSKQAAQRDQELANGLDNLNENVDAMKRYGVSLPAPLKELFDPSYNNETPLSIYGALVEEYQQFHPERWGVFSSPTFSTFWLLTLNQRIFFEANIDSAATGFDVPWAQLDFLINDHLTAVVGRYLVPLGFYNERLAFEWGNKMPDDPLMFHQVAPLFSTNGIQLRGSSYIGGSPLKVEYAVYFGNGMELSSAPAAVADLADLGVLAGSDETHAKAVGGRLGLWLPSCGIMGGISGQYDYNYAPMSPFRLNIGIVSVDANYHRGNWDARFEATYMNQQAAAITGQDIQRTGMYFQLGYRPYDVSNFFVQKLEFVGRYSMERFTGIDPTGLDFTTFSDPTFVPVDRNQYAFSINYWFYPRGVIKFGYEINQELHGINLNDNIFFSQLVLAF
jgi:hypothetical protein